MADSTRDGGPGWGAMPAWAWGTSGLQASHTPDRGAGLHWGARPAWARDAGSLQAGHATNRGACLYWGPSVLVSGSPGDRCLVVPCYSVMATGLLLV